MPRLQSLLLEISEVGPLTKQFIIEKFHCTVLVNLLHYQEPLTMELRIRENYLITYPFQPNFSISRSGSQATQQLPALYARGSTSHSRSGLRPQGLRTRALCISPRALGARVAFRQPTTCSHVRIVIDYYVGIGTYGNPSGNYIHRSIIFRLQTQEKFHDAGAKFGGVGVIMIVGSVTFAGDDEAEEAAGYHGGILVG